MIFFCTELGQNIYWNELAMLHFTIRELPVLSYRSQYYMFFISGCRGVMVDIFVSHKFSEHHQEAVRYITDKFIGSKTPPWRPKDFRVSHSISRTLVSNMRCIENGSIQTLMVLILLFKPIIFSIAKNWFGSI